MVPTSRTKVALLEANWLGITREVFDSLKPIQKRFLQAMPHNLTIRATCEAAKMSLESVHKWRRTDPVFRKCFDALKDLIVEELEEEAVVRASKGYTKDVYYKGTVVGQERVVSDQLLIFLLRAAKPDVYREKNVMDLNVNPLNTQESEFRNLSTPTLIEVKKLIAQDRARKQQQTIQGQVESSAT